MKLSKTMQAAMNEFINAPFAEGELVGSDSVIHFEDDYIYAPYYGKLSDGTIRTRKISTTIKGLEKRGLIEVVVDGGGMADRIRLLQHENNSVTLFDQHDLVEIEIYYIPHNRDKEARLNDTQRDFVKDGIAEYALRYWGKVDGIGRGFNVTRIVRKDTGEEIYRAAN